MSFSIIKVFAILLFCVINTQSYADDGKLAPILLGHNMTPTTNTVPAGKWNIGSYSLSYGITDNFMIGTSPFLVIAYNMPTLGLKYRFDTNFWFTSVAIEQLYFKTFSYFLDYYKQESTWTRLTATRRFNDNYSLHVNVGFQYYFIDSATFSMHPIPTINTPVTISASTLQEIHFTKNFGTFLEGGLVGLNYPNRFLHLGFSLFYQWTGGYLQLGASRTYPIGPVYMDASRYQPWVDSNSQTHYSIYAIHRNPFHPEVQLQFLF